MSVIDLTNDEFTVHEQIKWKLDELGISESELCRKAGVDRQLMFRLSKKDSKQIITLRKLATAIEEIELKQNQKEKEDEC